jgi:DNA-binding beta-propeller fold protein YncE
MFLYMTVQASGYAALPQYGLVQPIVTGQECPVGLATDRSDSLYWVNYCTGQLLKLVRGTGSSTVLLSGLNGPEGVGVDASGNVYYDEYFAGTLSELPAGSKTPSVLLIGLDYPNVISVDAKGNVYFITGQSAGDKIVRFDMKTKTLETLVTAPLPHDRGHGFSGVFIDSSGDLYYTMIGYDKIYRLPAGSSTPVLMLDASRPNGVAVDKAGDLFYALYYASVNVLPVGTSTSIVLTTAASSHTQITLDQHDDVYYTDNISGVIWEIPVKVPYTIYLDWTWSNYDILIRWLIACTLNMSMRVRSP